LPLCTCGHEQPDHVLSEAGCSRAGCLCLRFHEIPGYARTTSFSDLPVSEGARDLFGALTVDQSSRSLQAVRGALETLAAADPRDVRNVLWAVRVGKL
jgi:hypothetical protein